MDEVHALLVVQAAYETQHWDVRPHWQAQLLHSQGTVKRGGGKVIYSQQCAPPPPPTGHPIIRGAVAELDESAVKPSIGMCPPLAAPTPAQSRRH